METCSESAYFFAGFADLPILEKLAWLVFLALAQQRAGAAKISFTCVLIGGHHSAEQVCDRDRTHLLTSLCSA